MHTISRATAPATNFDAPIATGEMLTSAADYNELISHRSSAWLLARKAARAAGAIGALDA